MSVTVSVIETGRLVFAPNAVSFTGILVVLMRWKRPRIDEDLHRGLTLGEGRTLHLIAVSPPDPTRSWWRS
ncbi:hypothetical protein GFY24_08265 [Nocardia sp. SYP-A9097]|uniref:hypothetical protein n=1 Tax=Nocardia sp. SYP-A9097 TaxID=2663237 RepID=UPI00129B091C|nr:hypothetical protein [Nocardia sp. SYP-A9097]MRH87451.1 hypothetical protein [Nocardia sp. SYP-A9097]